MSMIIRRYKLANNSNLKRKRMVSQPTSSSESEPSWNEFSDSELKTGNPDSKGKGMVTLDPYDPSDRARLTELFRSKDPYHINLVSNFPGEPSSRVVPKSEPVEFVPPTAPLLGNRSSRPPSVGPPPGFPTPLHLLKGVVDPSDDFYNFSTRVSPSSFEEVEKLLLPKARMEMYTMDEVRVAEDAAVSLYQVMAYPLKLSPSSFRSLIGFFSFSW